MTTEDRLQCGTAEIRSSADEHSDLSNNYECVVAGITGKPLDDDVTITSHWDSEEFRAHTVQENLDADAMQSRDSVTSFEGQIHQTFDLEDRQSAESCEVDQKLRCEAVSGDLKPGGGATTVGGQGKPKLDRVCDDCGDRKTSATSRENTRRWNSPASQQPPARIQRTTRSAGRQWQASVGDRTRRSGSNVSGDDNKGLSGAQNAKNCSRQQTAQHKQPICRDNHSVSSPTRTGNGTAAESAASGRRDVTSGHVTRRSLSAKMVSSVTLVPGRRCQSTDDRRQHVTGNDGELTHAPFRRKCCCPTTRNSQGHCQGQGQGQQVASEGQTGASSRPAERRGLPDAISKPWARTLRDYGCGSDKSPSPVRSRRSTPESAVNYSRPSTRAMTTRTDSELVCSGQDLQAKPRPVAPSQTKRPTPAVLGITKSDSTLVQRRSEMKISSVVSPNIPASSSLGTVTSRRALNAATAGGNSANQTARERRRTTRNNTSGKQQDDGPSQSINKVTAASQVTCISGRRRKNTTSPAAQVGSKPITSSPSVSSSHNSTVDICDLHDDLENVPSRAPAATSLQPEVFHRTLARRRPRLAGNDDVTNDISSVTSLVKSNPARQRSHASESLWGVGTAKVRSGHVTSMTSSTVHRNLDLDKCNVGQLAGRVAKKKLATKTRTSLLHQRDETANTCIINLNFTSDGLLSQTSCTIIDAASCQNSQFGSISIVAPLVQESRNTGENGHVADMGKNFQDRKSSNSIKDTNANSGISVTKIDQKNSKAKDFDGKDVETERDNTRKLSPFDELDIERDFEFMDEILSSITTAEMHRFIKPPDCGLSDGPSTRFDSIPVDTLPGQIKVCAADGMSESTCTVVYSSRLTSTSEVRPAKSITGELLYTVDTVIADPVIEVAKSLIQDHCLSSPQLSDYVAENHYKVDEVSAEQHHHHHHHHHAAGSGRRQDDGSPSSDEIVLGSSEDASTKCSLSSPSGSQLSQDSCRWRSPDDSTLVGDPELCSISTSLCRPDDGAMLHCSKNKAAATCSNDLTLVGDLVEQREESASLVTLRQCAVDFDLTFTNRDATSRSSGSPGVPRLARSRPLIPSRRSRPFERHWSPDLSCFRQPRSPDLPDEDFAPSSYPEKISAEDEVIGAQSRSRLLRRLLFSGRITEPGKLKLQGSSTTDCVMGNNSDDTAVNSSTGNGSTLNGYDDGDDLNKGVMT